MTAILYYISGHGYGHAVRSAQVTRALLKARPQLEIHVRTSAPRWLFPRSALYAVRSLDVGLVQRDSLNMDLGATVRACQALFGDAETVIEQEIAFVRDKKIGLIVADIPPLAFEIAARVSIPSVAITNFSWNVIYRAYTNGFKEFVPLVAQIENYQEKTTLLLKLPYPCPMQAFPNQEPIPWIARRPRISKTAARKEFGLPQDATIALLSFGGLGLNRLPWSKLKTQRQFFFVATGDDKHEDGNILVLPDTQRHYEDLLRGVDLLVTKPGYGIVADVLAQRLPILYTDRGEFPEYQYLVQALNECANADYIPQSDLLAGNIAEYATQLLSKSSNWPPVALDGARVAAERILSLLG